MGVGIELSCTCGGTMSLPVGPANRRRPSCFFPCLCRSCKCMSNLDVCDPKHLLCAHCGGSDVVPYGSPEALGERGAQIVFKCRSKRAAFPVELLTLTNGKYWCPACETFSLEFRETDIHWD